MMAVGTGHYNYAMANIVVMRIVESDIAWDISKSEIDFCRSFAHSLQLYVHLSTEEIHC